MLVIILSKHPLRDRSFLIGNQFDYFPNPRNTVICRIFKFAKKVMDVPPQQPSAQFLSLEESAKVDAALLTSPEKFLTRLTISSLKLLTHIAEEYGVEIKDLTSPQIIAWFEKDSKLRQEQGSEAAYLKW